MKVTITEDDYRAAIQEHLPPLVTSHVLEAARIHAAMRLLSESNSRMLGVAKAMHGLTGEPFKRAQREFDREMKRGDELRAIAFPGQAEREGRS